MRTRPLADEYPENYGGYVDLVPNRDIETVLAAQHAQTMAFLHALEELEGAPYAPGKWSLKEVIGHMTDTERVMSYRLLAVARNDSTPLPGMDQDLYVAGANFNQSTWKQLQAEYDAVRSATRSLFHTIDDAAWLRKGTLSSGPASTRAIAYIIAGHELHHLQVIRDKYL